MSANSRILIIDDNQEIHADFRKVFSAVSARTSEINDLESQLFGPAAASVPSPGRTLPHCTLRGIDVESAFHGEEGVELVERAVEAGQLYLLAFVDVRMPPGIDGIQTIKKIWQFAPD